MTKRKTDLEERLSHEIQRLEARIELAKAQLAKEKVEAEAEISSLLRTVEGKRDEAREQLTRLRDSGSEAWEEASDGASKAWQELKGAYNELERGLSRAAEAVTA
jgi:thioredoxin-like negative regulator of GroEL